MTDSRANADGDWLKTAHPALDGRPRGQATSKADANCTACKGSGWVASTWTNETGADHERMGSCKCLFSGPIWRALEAGVPEALLDVSFATMRPTLRASAEVRKILEWLEDMHRPLGLWLSGTTGTGKTWAAVSCLAWAGRKGSWPVRFLSVPLWTDYLRSHMGEAEVDDGIRRAQDARLLVLDDLGRERSTEWTRSLVENTIEHRLVSQLATIITTNLTPKQVRNDSGYGERIASRVSTFCRVQFKGPDLRRQQNQPRLITPATDEVRADV